MLGLLIFVCVLIAGWLLALGAVLWMAAMGMAALIRMALWLLVGFGRFSLKTRP